MSDEIDKLKATLEEYRLVNTIMADAISRIRQVFVRLDNDIKIKLEGNRRIARKADK